MLYEFNYSPTTALKIDDFDLICRICLQKSEFMLHISTLNIIPMIEACSAIRITLTDTLPQQVCQKCVKHLENAWQIGKQCESADKHLRKLIETQSELKLEIKSENFKNENDSNYGHDDEVDTELSIKSENNTENDDVTTNDVYDESSTHKHLSNNIKRSRKILNKKTTTKCEQCDESFSHVWGLGLHMKDKHSVDPLACKKCDQQFYHRLHLEDHLNKHDNIEFKCKICEKQFDTVNIRRKHEFKHNPKIFHCFKCDRSFKAKYMLNKHEQDHHSGERPREACLICGKSIMQSNMGAHMKIHKERIPFSCQECPKKFIREITLKEHVLKIHQNGQIPLKELCTICGRKVRGKSELRRHMRSHTDERPFSCKLCDKRYRENKALTRHVLSVHINDRPFACTICSKAFHTKAILQAHMRSHTGEKPYSCLICNKAFGSKSWLKAHIKGHSE
ncbi:gastrula zinc finger protein XlCGF57.1-like [Chrysoperla carnea]|uniref:gastrula zinc finger protein XlCGF57.1-like n=1 Tax=Chrysoperla carnea TaxID=189513 RepID=UPI001D07ED5A|nr:gastrula zinc finger protein XlCGF57.1-like [Chrysoperla carnea]